MINLACAILNRDLTKNAYTLEYLGIDNMTVEELNTYLREGKK